jgi:exodeoxyribonuclease III
VDIATWNVNSIRVRMPQLAAWIGAAAPDILALQETKIVDSDFPAADLSALGYQFAFSGQKAYNGVALLARAPLAEITTDLPGFSDPQRRMLAATIGRLRVINVYVPNGQSLESEKFQYKLNWLAALKEYLAAELKAYPELVMLGDFNIAPADIDVHDPKAWEGSVHVSEPERRALRELLALGVTDVFRKFSQPPNTFSWWDYRMGAFRRNHGLRIDLILASTALAEHCSRVHIDREPRVWERPSDHAPCIASFDILANPAV